MTRNNIIKLHVIVLLFIVMGCVSTNITNKSQRVEPHPCILSLWTSNDITSISYFNVNSNKLDSTNSIRHQLVYTINGEHYVFHICSENDTADVYIHKKYIFSNLDTVRIFLRNSNEQSSINVYPDASWVRIGYAHYLASDCQVKDCFVNSTRPIKIEVYLIVNRMYDNTNPSYQDEQKSRIELYVDSLRDELFKQINNEK